MIAEIYSIPFQIKELRNEYASVINNEAAFKGHEIEFKVEVPFKKEEFFCHCTLKYALSYISIFKNILHILLFMSNISNIYIEIV